MILQTQKWYAVYVWTITSTRKLVANIQQSLTYNITLRNYIWAPSKKVENIDKSKMFKTLVIDKCSKFN